MQTHPAVDELLPGLSSSLSQSQDALSSQLERIMTTLYVPKPDDLDVKTWKWDDHYDFPRNSVGYGSKSHNPQWPNGAKIAVSFVINYEEGAENCVVSTAVVITHASYTYILQTHDETTTPDTLNSNASHRSLLLARIAANMAHLIAQWRPTQRDGTMGEARRCTIYPRACRQHRIRV